MNFLRKDGWANLLKGFGFKHKDPKQSTKFIANDKLAREDCEALYNFNGLAQRIIDVPVNDMTRAGFRVCGDTENCIESDLKKKGFNSALADFLTWDRLFGGSLLVMFINDGGKLSDPLNKKAIKSVDAFRVFDRYEVDKISYLEMDPASDRFGEPVMYRVTNVNGVQFDVHYTRAICRTGTRVSNRERRKNAGYGYSALDSVFEGLRAYGEVFQSLEEIVGSFELRTVSIQGLADIVSEGNSKALYDRLELFEMGRHVLNTMLLDENEKFEKHASSVSGLDGLVEKFFDRITSDAGIPGRILLGRQTVGGLDKSGSSETRDWYDSIASRQTIELAPVVERVVELSMIASAGPTCGQCIENWSVEFNSLWTPTEAEQVATRKTQAEVDQIYVSASVLSPEEVAISRFGGDQYSTETHLSGEREMNPVPEVEPEEVEPEEVDPNAPAPAEGKGSDPADPNDPEQETEAEIDRDAGSRRGE